MFGLCCATEDMREGTRAFWKNEQRNFREVDLRRMTPDKIQPAAITGVLSAAGLRIGVVVSRFNQFITDRLLAGALDALERSGGCGGSD